MQLDTIIIAGALGTLLPGTAIVMLLRTFYITTISYARGSEGMDLSWRDYRPFHRLLDPDDFAFLRDRGISEARVKKLVAERRRIYRLCLRSLASDFNTVHRALNMVLIHSQVDRPDLAAHLAKQRFTFYRNLMMVEIRLALHTWGVRMPAIDLLQPLEMLQAQLGMLAAAGAAA